MNWEAAVDAFAEIGGYPTDEMAWVLAEWETTGPACRALLHDYVSGVDLSERIERALFFVIPMLGEKADTGAFPDLCRLAMDTERSSTVLGEEAASEILPPVLLSTFDGHRAALYRLVETPAVDEFLRADTLLALAYLARTRQIPEAELYDYLAGLPDRLETTAGEVVWLGWVRVVAAMGFAGLSGRVEQIFRDKVFDPSAMTPADFWAELRVSQENPHGMASDLWFGVGPMGSAIDWIDAFTAEEEEVEERPEPIRNPLRNVGRNDPCPCGSGKKYKKCCLAA